MSYVAKIIIDHTKVPSNLTDFPVYVNLADLPSSFWSVVADGGGDIRVFKSDDTTELPREVVSCVQASDTGELHFKYTGTLSSTVDTEVHIYADGVSSDYAVTDTYGRNNVWKSGYKAVLHHQNAGTDSTGNGDWTDTGSPSYSAVTPSQGVDISASTKWVARTNDGGLTSRTAPMTMSVFTKFKTTTSGQVLCAWGDYAQAFYYELRYENTGSWSLCSIKNQGSEVRINIAWTPSTTSTPIHTAVRFDGTNMVHYAEGSQIGTHAPSAGSGSNTLMDFMAVGAIAHGSGYLQNFWGNNIHSESRFYLGDLGADWLLAEKNNLTSASTFYTASSGSTNVSVSATVVSATFSAPSRTVTGTALVSATVQTATFSSPARTVTGASNVTAGVVSATFSIPLVNIITPDAQILASVVSATFSIPAPTAQISTVFSQGTPPSATFSMPASSVQIGYIHASNVFSATFSIPTPTISAESNIVVSPSALSATFSLPAVTVTGEQNAMFEATALSATFSIPTVTVTAVRHITIDATVLSATFSILQPRKVGGLWTAQPREEGVWTPQARQT